MYDEFQGRQDPKDAEVEREIETWLRRLPEPKYLDKPNFVKIGRWKTKRQTRAYESNDQVLVEKATRLAYLEDEPLLKLPSSKFSGVSAWGCLRPSCTSCIPIASHSRLSLVSPGDPDGLQISVDD